MALSALKPLYLRLRSSRRLRQGVSEKRTAGKEGGGVVNSGLRVRNFQKGQVVGLVYDQAG